MNLPLTPMDDEELSAWLRLAITPGIGNGTARRLLAAFGLPEAIFRQSAITLRQLVSPSQATALLQPPDKLPQQIELTRQWLREPGQATQRALVPLADTRYPASLLAIEDPPLMLYLQGRVDLLVHDVAACAANQPPTDLWPEQAIAMVGSRNPTPQGALNARQFARALADHGLSIISGLALGIDGAAHEGALSVCNAKAPSQRLITIAVVGTGLDRVYPRQHHELTQRIATHGLIVSEFALGTPPLAPNFPRRNRLLSGLTRGTLVVEAATQSGSLITARLAAEQGKEVFAIPGSIHSPQSRGCHALIRQGAKLVETADDVLEELRWQRSPVSATMQTPHDQLEENPATTGRHSNHTETAILQAMGADPVSLDALLARTKMEAAALQAKLLELELDGAVARLPGGLFQMMKQA